MDARSSGWGVCAIIWARAVAGPVLLLGKGRQKLNRKMCICELSDLPNGILFCFDVNFTSEAKFLSIAFKGRMLRCSLPLTTSRTFFLRDARIFPLKNAP